MDRVAVFVDAGYLFAEGGRELAGDPARERVARSEVVIDPLQAVRHLTRFAQETAGVPLLRIYWYDGTANRPTRTQVAMAEQAGVKLRLGRIDARGRQKGVDALIASDMVTLARNRAICDCVLLAGDDEFRIAVTEIQQLGIRVHLLGIGCAVRTQSRLLRQEADSTTQWDAQALGEFFFRRSRPPSDTAGADALGTRLAPPQGCAPARVGSNDGLGSVGAGDRASGSSLRRAPRRPDTREIARRVAREVLINEFIGRTGRWPAGRAAP